MLRIVRNLSCVAVFLLLVCGSGFANPTELNLNFQSGTETTGPPFSSGALVFFSPNGGLPVVADVLFDGGSFTVVPGPNANCNAGENPSTCIGNCEQNEPLTECTADIFGAGGSIEIYANNTEYIGTFLRAKSVDSEDFAAFSGTFILDGFTGEGSLFAQEGDSGGVTGGSLTFAPTPEPSTLLLMFFGMGFLAASARRRISV